MKLIVDTNIFLKALIKNSKVRAILLDLGHQFFAPEYAMEEVEKHLPLLVEKTGLSEEEIRLALNIVLTNIQVIPTENILTKWSEAEEVMKSIDKDDVPLIAAALSIPCEGIWSDDKDFKRQRKVRVWNSKEIVIRLRPPSTGI